MKITILSKEKLKTQYNNVVKPTPILNDDSDIVIVNSDDYFDDKLFDYLLRLKKKYLTLLVIGFNHPQLVLYNKQYVDFCFDHNINFLDYDQTNGELDDYLASNIVIQPDYTKFSSYYLKLQPEIDYKSWFGVDKFENKGVVDLGCGVPGYLRELNPRSYLGIDLSSEMISKAKKMYPNYQFIVGSILDASYEADVVISLFDVFNYLPNIEAVKTVINNVYENLNPGGEFIFDVHTKAVLRNFKNYFDFEDNDDEQFIWESDVNAHRICHYFQIIDKNYKLFIEKHYQYYYDIDLIYKQLEAVGFKINKIEVAYNHHILHTMKEKNE